MAVASVAALSSLLLLSMLLQCGGHPGGGGGTNTTTQIVETTPVEANRRWRRNSWRLKEHQGQLFHIEGDTAMNGHAAGGGGDFEGRGAG